MQVDGVSVGDKETAFNLETGYWGGSCGREGYGIDAYFEYEDSDDVFVVQWIVSHIEWHVGEAGGGMYPPIVQLKAQAGLGGGGVSFHVSAHPQRSWKYLSSRYGTVLSLR